ncbi:MAG: HD domain-containing phosphohydrolase, partial [Desulfobaccales bacterium]
DDRPDNLFVLEQVVGAYLPEIKMITAESAEAGLALVATEAIDGALIDVQMPGMNGIEMCRRLKADPRTASIHVILVTAHRATSELKAQGLDAGADDFITKPIDNVELAAKLRVMLRLRAAEQALRRERDHLEDTVLERTKALRDAEYRYRTLFQTAGDAIFINDLEGRMLEVNDEACRLLGHTPDELLKLTVSDVISPEYEDRRPEILKQLQAKGHVVFENELVTRDGRIIPTECNSRLMDLQGRPAVLSIARDISERQTAAAALRKSEELYRSLFENMLNGFAYCKMLFDQNQPQDFIYLAVNSSFEALTGLENVVGKKVSEVIPGLGESDPNLLQIYGRVALTGKPERVEIYVEALKMWFSLSVYSPAKDYFVAVFDVITERKQAEEALKESLARVTEVQYGTIEALAMVTEARDPYTAGHQRRVTQLACAVARELGLPADRVAGLRVMGLLHDIGKISIPAEILSKPGKLSDTEFAIITSHAQPGYEIVKEIRFPWPVAEVILQHHERMDGSGYPQGLTGPDIILEARILAVADVVEAMASHRPYRPALRIESALKEITQKKGLLYDPEVVDACFKLFTEKGFQFA